MNDNFLSLREECCEANKQLPKLGIVDLTFGNVSVGDPDLGAVAIKPSGLPYELLTPAEICVMDFNAQPDDNFQMDLEDSIAANQLNVLCNFVLPSLEQEHW